MPISFSCECGKAMKVKDEYAGKRAKCPACGQGVVVPDAAYEVEQPAVFTSSPALDRIDLGLDRADPPDGEATDVVIPPPIPLPSVPTPFGRSPSESSSLGYRREPPCYGFLEKYAKAVRWLGITLAAISFLPVFGMYVMPLMTRINERPANWTILSIVGIEHCRYCYSIHDFVYCSDSCDFHCPCDGSETLAFRRLLQVLPCLTSVGGDDSVLTAS